jgi:hypothetical protein
MENQTNRTERRRLSWAVVVLAAIVAAVVIASPTLAIYGFTLVVIALAGAR